MKLNSYVNYILVIWLAIIFLSFYLGFSTLPHSEKFFNTFWESLSNWDGGHFIGIAKTGYSEKFQYAFFPLYPLIVRLLNQLTQNYLVSAVLISIVSTFFSLHIFYKLVAADFDKQSLRSKDLKKIAEKSILAFLFFPTSFFLITAYSESLFFFLVVTAFYFLKGNKLFWATVFIALASATRLVGLAAVVGLWIDVLTRYGLNKKNWFVLFAPLGFILYCIFLHQQTGDPFYFVTAENHWQRLLTTPGAGFWETLRSIFSGGFNLSNFNILDLLFAIFGVGLAIRSFRFLPTSFAIYSLLSVGAPLFTPTLSSMPRFLLPIFPLFILVALIKNPYLQLAFQMFSLVLLGIFTALFAAGYWVA